LLDTTTDEVVDKLLAELVCESPTQITQYLRFCISADLPVLGSLSWCFFEQCPPMPCYGQAFPVQRILLRCVPDAASLHDPQTGPASPAECLQQISRRSWLAGKQKVGRGCTKKPRAMENVPQQHAQAIQELRERLVRFHGFSILNELATGIAHEINQSLTGISTYARGCRRQLELGRENSANVLLVLDKISDQAQRSGEFIHSLRKLSKKHSGDRERCDLNQLVQDCLMLVAVDAWRPEVPIDAVFADGRLPVIADPIQIQQAILHLLQNANDAMSDSSAKNAVISVTTSVDGREFAKVEVTDQGSGLSIEAREKLFDPFFTTKPHGLGMGLAVCRTAILSHGGRIGFTEHSAGGTTLYFALPLAVGDAGNG
jgi:C4-dicarboxylate-specific signal transduction histidine kinase